jgi:hypothetical protein
MKDNKTCKQQTQTNSSAFRYYNCNPHSKITDDCVIRAIAAGTGEPWQKILKDLTSYMIKYGYMLNTPELYGKYLQDNGWVKQKQPIHHNGSKMRIGEFVKQFKGCAIVHAGCGHVTYIAEGNVYDIWDTSNEIIGNYWTYKGE